MARKSPVSQRGDCVIAIGLVPATRRQRRAVRIRARAALLPRGAIEPIRALLDQVDAHFDTFGKSFDGFFYNEVVRLAAVPSMAPYSEELRDPALQSLVRRLRQGIAGHQPATALVASLLGRTKLWPTAVVSDAEFAATTEQRHSRAGAAVATHDPRMLRVQIERGTVTAVCQSRVTGEVYLGFAGGQVISYRADRNLVIKVGEGAGTVAGLAVDPTGQTLVTLRQFDREAVLSSFRKHPNGSYRHRPDVHFSVSPQSWLTPVLPLGVERLVGLSDGRDLQIIDAASAILWQRRRISMSAIRPVVGPLAPGGFAGRSAAQPAHDLDPRRAALDRRQREWRIAPRDVF